MRASRIKYMDDGQKGLTIFSDLMGRLWSQILNLDFLFKKIPAVTSLESLNRKEIRVDQSSCDRFTRIT